MIEEALMLPLRAPTLNFICLDSGRPVNFGRILTYEWLLIFYQYVTM